MKKFLFFLLILLIASCTTIKYVDDVGFLDAAQANSYEFPVKVNGTTCKDMLGNVGLCSIRWANNQDFVMNIDPQVFSYTYVLTCSNGLNVNQSESIAANTSTAVTIPYANYGALLEFTCILQINPSDRTAVSAQSEIRVVLYDPNYQAREKMYLTKQGIFTYLVLGQYALYSYVCDSGKCSSYTKETTIKVNNTTGLTAYSQSYQERFNFWGY